MSITASYPSDTRQENAAWALAGNTIVCGIAATFMLGPIVGVCCAIVNLALAKLNEENSQGAWFPLNDKVIDQLIDYWENSYFYFKAQIVIGIFLRVFELTVDQEVIQYLKNALTDPLQTIYAIFKLTVLGPVFEEILFRGFLQEKLRDLQVVILGVEEADSKVHQVIRIVLQAIVFGLCHFHPAQGLFNIYIVIVAAGMGIYFGIQKEDTFNLWSSSAHHVHCNTSITSRVIVFGS